MIELTPELAYAAGHDAGNRSMQKGNRASWNDDDLDAAVLETQRLLAIFETTDEQDD